MARRVQLVFGWLAEGRGFPRSIEVGHRTRQEIRAHADEPGGRRELAELVDLHGGEVERIEDSITMLLSSGVLVYEDRTVETPAHSAEHDDPVALTELAGSDTDDEVTLTHSVAIELVGEDDEPIPHAAYRLLEPNGRARSGRLDNDGRAEVHGIKESGDCKICFPDFDAEAWEYVSAMPL